MITAADITRVWMALMSQRCRCGAKKPQGHPFCAACIDKLPPPLQSALFEHLLHNITDRFLEAREYLEGSSQPSALSIQPGEIFRLKHGEQS
jgi:hypothetical protein